LREKKQQQKEEEKEKEGRKGKEYFHEKRFKKI